MRFRPLTASEIDCRVATINEKGLTLLLYKDARVDMNILDETFGVTGWQRKHEIQNRMSVLKAIPRKRKGRRATVSKGLASTSESAGSCTLRRSSGLERINSSSLKRITSTLLMISL